MWNTSFWSNLVQYRPLLLSHWLQPADPVTVNMSGVLQWASVFSLKQACKLGASQLLRDTEFSSNSQENKALCTVHPRCNSYHKKLDLKKTWVQLIKVLNEAMDSSSSVKGEAGRAPPLDSV